MKCLVATTYVTGYWKTDHNVTLGQLHFIGPANSHTHALSILQLLYNYLVMVTNDDCDF